MTSKHILLSVSSRNLEQKWQYSWPAKPNCNNKVTTWVLSAVTQVIITKVTTWVTADRTNGWPSCLSVMPDWSKCCVQWQHQSGKHSLNQAKLFIIFLKVSDNMCKSWYCLNNILWPSPFMRHMRREPARKFMQQLCYHIVCIKVMHRQSACAYGFTLVIAHSTILI